MASGRQHGPVCPWTAGKVLSRALEVPGTAPLALDIPAPTVTTAGAVAQRKTPTGLGDALLQAWEPKATLTHLVLGVQFSQESLRY